MRGAPTVLWTCDRCGRNEHVLADSTPSGWKRVVSTGLTAPHKQPHDYEGDWCKTCVGTYLATLPRAAKETP